MKAIIMAGGEGKRLKPVSGDTPKPLVPLCGRPVMEHIVLLLKKHGITDICASLRYRPEDIKSCFGSGERLGANMQYRTEDEALGTAGGVKNCADFYGNDDFLVISGDAACDFDLTELIKAHQEHRPAVTIALYPHSEPLRYGLALCGRDHCVHSFIEKPDWEHVVTNLVNTGVYIVSPKAMELVPEGAVFDFAKDLFPALLDRDEKLLGCPLDGYWCDIGTPKSYYQCCVDALDGKLNVELTNGFESTPTEEKKHGEERKFMYREQVTCADRARLMDRICAAFMDMGAEFDDGFCFRGSDYELRISAVPDAAAVRICANAADTELARELAVSASELVHEMENRLDK